MFNSETKTIINKLQYIIDRFVKVKFYNTPKKVINESHIVEKRADGKYISFFGEIISNENNYTVNVYKETLANGDVADFTQYIIVDSLPLQKNECFIDKSNNLIYFHESQLNCKISTTYYSIGIGMISSALIYTHFDSNSTVMETLSELTRKCQVELDRIATITEAEQLKVELKTYIISLTELMSKYPNPSKILAELKGLIQEAENLKPQLEATIQEGIRIMEEIKTASNVPIIITSNSWVNAGEGRYKYVATHNLNSSNLIIETTQISNGVETSCVIDYEKSSDNKTITFYTYDNTITVKAVLNASYYCGLPSELTTGFSTSASREDLLVNISYLENKVDSLTQEIDYLKRTVEVLTQKL